MSKNTLIMKKRDHLAHTRAVSSSNTLVHNTAAIAGTNGADGHPQQPEPEPDPHPLAFVDIETVKPRDKPEGGGGTRNLGEDFAKHRAEKKVTRERMYMIVVKRLAQLTIEHLAKPQDPGMLSWFGLGGATPSITVKGIDDNLQAPPASAAKACFSCQNAFGWLQKKMLCQLCLVYCCSNCVKPRVPLQVIQEQVNGAVKGPGPTPNVPMIETCQRCARIVRKWKFQLAFQRCRLNATAHPLSVTYENLLKRDANVMEALQAYDASVGEVDVCMKSRRSTKRQDAENILAMRLADAVQQSKMVEKQLHAMSGMIKEINTFLPPPRPAPPHGRPGAGGGGNGGARSSSREPSPPPHAGIPAHVREARKEAGDPIRVTTKSDSRHLVYNISYAADNRMDMHVDSFQDLQKRVVRSQLLIAGEVYNKIHQLELELKEMNTTAQFDRGETNVIARNPKSNSNNTHNNTHNTQNNTQNKESYLPNIYFFVSEIMTVMKAEIHELMIAMGKQHWIKFEKRLDAALREQMKDNRILGVQVAGKVQGMDRELALAKVLGVLQYEIKMLENNTAPSTLRESKNVINRLISTLLSQYF
eukprot:TRINITY_DN2414_c2_g2_i1.p1 TRINITY_DN2414_c2_g2~~TRINITY_DN2414_c2_g2_i1.p1  ORF type:complete len:588 (+),score=120.55 TRINITY_DN2414_c2_g2_i1:220-1983(+)